MILAIYWLVDCGIVDYINSLLRVLSVARRRPRFRVVIYLVLLGPLIWLCLLDREYFLRSPINPFQHLFYDNLAMVITHRQVVGWFITTGPPSKNYCGMKRKSRITIQGLYLMMPMFLG